MIETKTLEESVEDYLRYLDLVRNAAANTIKSYRSDLAEAVACFRALVGTAELSPELLTPALLRSYQTKLSQREIGPASICRKLTAMRSFCKWLERQGRLAEDPALGLRGPRYHAPLPVATSYADVTRLLSAPNRSHPLGSRNFAMLATAYSAALRVSELVGLDLYDLDLNEGLLKLRHTKGKRDGFGVLGPQAIDAVSDWLGWRKKMGQTIAIDPDAVFLNCDGGRLSTRAVSRVLQACAGSVKIERRCTMHGLRHAAACHCLANGATLPDIKELLRHQSLRTATIYANLSPEQLHQELRQRHPRA